MIRKIIINDLKENDRQWLVICLILVLWIIFLFSKINGRLDYSAKYGIEWITCREEPNRLLLIDGDNETNWGMEDDHAKGEQINFHFRQDRCFQKISIINATNSKTQIMNIYVSTDGENFEKCEYHLNIVDEGKYEFLLTKQYYGEYLRFEYTNEDMGKWPITEVEIYE